MPGQRSLLSGEELSWPVGPAASPPWGEAQDSPPLSLGPSPPGLCVGRVPRPGATEDGLVRARMR